MIIFKSKTGKGFTFELDAADLAQLAVNIQRSDWRALIRDEDTREFLGSLEFSTMQFRPSLGKKQKFDAMEIGESLSVMIQPSLN